jgi:hypothetical protein
MGQYYKPCILGKNKKTVKAWLYSHDYDSGLKLMEHSWMLNEFVGAFESMLLPHGKYYKSPVVWAGDYAEEEEGSKTNVYGRCKDKNKLNPHKGMIDPIYRYLVNHTKKQYVDKMEVPDKDDWRIHPLPLLTCEGNGQGGGDYFSKDPNSIVGSWARDVISIEKVLPENYTKINFDLVE